MYGENHTVGFLKVNQAVGIALTQLPLVSIIELLTELPSDWRGMWNQPRGSSAPNRRQPFAWVVAPTDWSVLFYACGVRIFNK